MSASEPASLDVPLQAQLDLITAHTRSLVPPERLARTDEVVAALRASGIEHGILAVGRTAPEFELSSANGKRVCLADLLALGPVIVKFFRGRWCPYDMTELETWQALQAQLRQPAPGSDSGHRALFVAVSPQTPRQNAFTAERHKLTFPILSDPGAVVAAQFGVAYTVPEATQAWYRSMLVNVPFLNGENSWRLPLPGTFALSRKGEVLYSVALADHRQRPDPGEALRVLQDRSAAR